MAGSARFEVDMALNASGVAKGATDGKKALADLEAAVSGVADESQKSGNTVDSFADKVTRAAREAGKSDDEIKDALRSYGVNAKDAERAIERVGSEFKETGREGDRAGDKLEDAMRDVQRQSERTQRSVDDIGGKGFGKASEAVGEFKQEALQNLSEVTSSFDGSLSSIGELAQGTLGGVASSIPGIGLAAAGAAAGVGVLTEAITKVQEAADEARESAYSMAYDVAGALDAAGYAARLDEWTNSSEKLKQARDLATIAGWDEVDALDALASGGDKLDSLTTAFAEHGATNAEALAMTSGRLWELEAVLKATGEGYLSGAEGAELAASALYSFATKAGEATGDVDELGNAIYRLPDDTEVVVNAATAKAYESVDTFEQKVAGVKDKNVNINVGTRGMDAAQRDFDRFVARNNGRTIRVNGRVDLAPSGWNQ